MDLREEMKRRIQEAHPDAEIQFNDVTGGGDHWEAMIVSEGFEGMNRIARQRSIYAALGDLMTGPIHAFTFRTLTPKQVQEEG